jgi:hypothetical protein
VWMPYLHIPPDCTLHPSQEFSDHSTPMTLLGAALDPDNGAIWLAADAKELRSDVWSDHSYAASGVEKLYDHGDRVAWGYYGENGKGSAFEYAFQTADLDQWNNWDEVEDVCVRAMIDLNKGRSLLGTVFGGFIRGESRIIGITPSGSVDRQAQYLFHGNGAVAARALWLAVERIRPDMSIRDRLTTAVGATIKADEWLGLPISVWRVSDSDPILKASLLADNLPT